MALSYRSIVYDDRRFTAANRGRSGNPGDGYAPGRGRRAPLRGGRAHHLAPWQDPVPRVGCAWRARKLQGWPPPPLQPSEPPALHQHAARRLGRDLKTSVVERIGVADVLQAAGRAQPDRRGFIHCPNPLHLDVHPSARVQSSGRGVRCHSCGWRGGLLDVAVALGLAPDRASAARRLEGRRR
jgi:hypothetical protein